ncbi:MAG: alpha/beta hydrolase [Acidimicrobiales bacterium]
MRRRRTRVAVSVIVVSLVLGAAPAEPSGAAAGGPNRQLAPALEWGPCPDQDELDPRQECALLPVPLDYRDPDGATIEIAVSRIQTSDPTLRRGVMLLNPGGPGGPGLDLPTLFAQVMPPEVLARYDLIGFDPRTIGRSAPVTCGRGGDFLDIITIIPWLRPGGVRENAEIAEAWADDCLAHNPELWPHATTANTARDMDQIRLALGEDKISYLGYSYGSYLGAVYGTLFPDQSDRFILDSVVNPFGVWRTVFRSWGPAIEIRFPDLTSWVAERDATYHLGSTSDAVRAMYFELAARLDAEPLPLPGFDLTGNLFREETRGALYSDESFPAIASVWQLVDELTGGAAAAVEQTDALAAGVTALFPDVPPDNGGAAILSVLCDDARWPESVRTYARDVRIDGRLFPVAGSMAANIWACAFWPDLVEPPVRITDDGPSNILLVQTLRDPATPWFGAVGMRLALGQRSRSVTVDAGDHGVYLFGVNQCADAAATEFLVTGQLPARDQFCPAEPRDVEATVVPAPVEELRGRMWLL